MARGLRLLPGNGLVGVGVGSSGDRTIWLENHLRNWGRRRSSWFKMDLRAHYKNARRSRAYFYGYNEGFRDIVLETIDRGGGDCLMWV